MYSMRGEIMPQNSLLKISQNHYQMDIKDLTPGLYFIYIESSSGVYYEKIIIQ